MNHIRALVATFLARLAYAIAPTADKLAIDGFEEPESVRIRRVREKLARDAEAYPEIFDQEKVKAYLSS